MILVAGGAGYIGSHTSAALLKSGYDVLIADDLSNSSRGAVNRVSEAAGRAVSFCEIDLKNASGVKELFSRYDIEGVIMLAGYKAVGESVAHPLKYYRNNIDIALTLLEQMEKSGAKRLIFSSSATVYDASFPSPLSEDSPTGPVNPYGQTKFMIEQILKDTAATGGWSVVSLRYFNPVGAHPSGLLGEAPSGVPQNLMPYISQVASGKREFLSVFGNDYPTPDGTGVRDYIHICDLAEGHIAALKYAETHEGIEFINLGTGKGTSVLELVNAFEEANGLKIPYRICARRPGDAAVCYAACAKAKELLGWEAKRDIVDMCRDAWRFERGAK